MDAVPPTLVGIAAAILSLVLLIVRRTTGERDDAASRRQRLAEERRRALAEGRLGDGGQANRALGRLLAAWLFLGAFGGLGGCQSARPGLIVIGERAHKPAPGDVLTVPPLIPPAAQWYLIDDVAMDALGFPAED